MENKKGVTQYTRTKTVEVVDNIASEVEIRRRQRCETVVQIGHVGSSNEYQASQQLDKNKSSNGVLALNSAVNQELRKSIHGLKNAMNNVHETYKKKSSARYKPYFDKLKQHEEEEEKLQKPVKQATSYLKKQNEDFMALMESILYRTTQHNEKLRSAEKNLGFRVETNGKQ